MKGLFMVVLGALALLLSTTPARDIRPAALFNLVLVGPFEYFLTRPALLWSRLGYDRAGLASAVLLGERSELTSAQREAFVETGTAHFLAISGLHIP